jgi:hypothetical protein
MNTMAVGYKFGKTQRCTQNCKVEISFVKPVVAGKERVGLD